MISLIPLSLLFLLLCGFVALSYSYKNLFFLLLAGVVSFLLAGNIWNGGIVEQTGFTISGNVSSSTVSMVQNAVYSPVKLGFSQNYLGTFFAAVGLLLFLTAVGSYAKGEAQ